MSTYVPKYLPQTAAQRLAVSRYTAQKRYQMGLFRHLLPYAVASVVLCAAVWFVMVIEHPGTLDSFQYGKTVASLVTLVALVAVYFTARPLVAVFRLKRPKAATAHPAPPQQRAA